MSGRVRMPRPARLILPVVSRKIYSISFDEGRSPTPSLDRTAEWRSDEDAMVTRRPRTITELSRDHAPPLAHFEYAGLPKHDLDVGCGEAAAVGGHFILLHNGLTDQRGIRRCLHVVLD